MSIDLNLQVQVPDLLILDEPLAGLGMEMNLVCLVPLHYLSSYLVLSSKSN